MSEDNFNGWSLKDIANDPDGYVAMIRKLYPKFPRRPAPGKIQTLFKRIFKSS